ncbi:hypothetical protein MKZ25_10005 [Solibacillus sp. FSL W7-1464]|uniref:hypothetical protein n=1 Tax=Solibacillus sp. FSL W7-1464 TaxID=2921706 RepID=UPI0030F84577
MHEMNAGIWLTFVTPIFLVSALYFTLSFFQYLKMDNDRLMTQSKWGAVISLAIALIVPAIYQIVVYYQVMNY